MKFCLFKISPNQTGLVKRSLHKAENVILVKNDLA